MADPKQGACYYRTQDRFPDSFLVFATLRNEISEEERQLLSALANVSATFGRADVVKPVEVWALSGRVLMGKLGPPECWREAGTSRVLARSWGRIASLEHRWHRSGGLMELRDATQNLHLGTG
jgi:hypothetical protein